jgi:hypothetical protein
MTERVIGNHLYSQCPMCMKWVRLTGWFARLHLCLSPREREEWRRIRGFQSDPYDADWVKKEKP